MMGVKLKTSSSFRCLLVAVLLLLPILNLSAASAAEIILPEKIEGLPYLRMDKSRPESSISIDDYKSGKFNLSISKKDGSYYWKSFGNKKLEVTEIPETKQTSAKTIFYDPKGEGKIYILHQVAITGPCPETDLSRGTNYIEYRLPDSGVGSAIISGTTKSYPFPVSDNCKK